MNIQSVAEELRELIKEFVGFKDYSEIGIVKLKSLENSMIGFSKTTDCLSVCIYILERQTISELQYFGSMLLKDKLKYDFEQMDSSTIRQVHKKICEIISLYQQPTMIVMINLCLCLIYIYMQCSSIMGDPLNYLNSSIKSKNLNYILKCLQMLPEEIDNSKVVIDDELRIGTAKMLEKYQKYVLVEIGKSTEEMWSNIHVNKTILFALFNNWVTITYNQEIINNLVDHPLLSKAIQFLSDPVLSDQACQCVAGIVNIIKSPQQNLKLFQYLSEVINTLIKKVAGLIKEGQTQVAQNYIKILCDFGLKAKKLFLENYNQNIHNFLYFLLSFMKEDELNCFSVMCEFWLGLIDQLIDHPILEQTALLRQLFALTRERITLSMQFLNEMNNLSIEKICKQHKEMQDLMAKRSEAKHLFKSICKIVGKQLLVNEAIHSLKKLDNNVETFWPELQSNIFALTCFIHDYPSLSNQILILVKSYTDLKPGLIAIKRSYLRLFRQLMTIRQKDVMFIQTLFIQIGQMFSEKLLADKAEKAFLKACENNPTIVCTNIDNFLILLSKNSSKYNILKGILGILNNDQSLMKQYIRPILNLYLEKIKSGKKDEVKEGLNCLYQAIKAISKPSSKAYQESVKDLLIEIWPMIKQSFLYPSNLVDDQDPHIQRCVKLLKIAMRSIKQSFIVLLPQIFQTTLQAYKLYPICSYLYLLQVSITVYYQFSDLLQYFRMLYCSFCEITFSHINDKQKIQKYQFLVDDFIGMNKRFFTYNAEIVLTTNKVSSLLNLVQLCCGCDIAKVTKGSYQFLEILYAFNWTSKMIEQFNAVQDNEPIKISQSAQKLFLPVKKILFQRTEILLVKMLDHLSRCPFVQTAQSILATLISQIKSFPDQNISIWSNLMPSIPEDILTRKQKDNFLHILPLFSGNEAGKAQLVIKKLLKTMNKRFKNRKQRQNLN